MTATIIEFKPKNSTSYINLKNLFEITESIDACNFYLETVETLANMNQISEKEKFGLHDSVEYCEIMTNCIVMAD